MSESSPLNRHFAESVVHTLRDAGYQAVFAGGCVRDLLLGRSPKDFDVATDARPDHIRNLFGKGRTLAVGESFGVVVVVPRKVDRERGVSPVEVATFRTEGDYRDGRHPGRVEFATAEQDAQRRDFTINGMFLDPVDNRVLDYVGGFDDLHKRRIRAIGDPYARMKEDKLRLLRAIRFSAGLDFELDPATSSAVRKMASQLIIVSAERITQELKRMLEHESRSRAMELCRKHGLLEVIFPEMESERIACKGFSSPLWEATLRILDDLIEPDFETALAGLLSSVLIPAAPGVLPSEIIEKMLARLRLSNAQWDRTLWLLARLGQLADFADFSLARTKRLAADPNAGRLLALERAFSQAHGKDLAPIEAFAEFLARTPSHELNPPLLVTGDDLIQSGLKPGPDFGKLLHAARDAQLDEVLATREQAIAFIYQLARNSTRRRDKK